MRLAVRQLKTIGCQASGLISDQDLVKAVAAETRGHYDEGDLGDRPARGHPAGAQPASGPGSSAAPPLGATADRLRHRPGHQARISDSRKTATTMPVREPIRTALNA